MFDTLADKMRQDDAKETTRSERVIRWIMVGVVSVVLFGGLYFGVSMLE
jgi:hypothetical protein